MRRSEDRTLWSRSRLSTKGAGSSMKSGRVGGMSADETVNSVRRVIVSSSRLPYFPRVMTPIESIGGILGCRRDKGLEAWSVEAPSAPPRIEFGGICGLEVAYMCERS